MSIFHDVGTKDGTAEGRHVDKRELRYRKMYSMDKSNTHTQCRFEASYLFGIDNIIIAGDSIDSISISFIYYYWSFYRITDTYSLADYINFIDQFKHTKLNLKT